MADTIFWSMRAMNLQLKFDWKISRSTSVSKLNFCINVTDGTHSGEGEVAYNIRYDESADLVRQQFSLFNEAVEGLYFSDLGELNQFLDDQDLCSSLRFGLESSWVHYWLKKSNHSFRDLFGVIPVQKLPTSHSIPILSSDDIGHFLTVYGLKRFHALKVKVDRDTAIDCVTELQNLYRGMIRVDANEAWKDPDEILKFLEAVDGRKLEFLEQPMPSDRVDEYVYLKKLSSVPLIGDESLKGGNVDLELGKQFHGLNVKLMKSGGYFQALRQIAQIKALGLSVMLGCMIETDLGISSAMNIGEGVDYFDLDGCLLIQGGGHLVVERMGILHRKGK